MSPNVMLGAKIEQDRKVELAKLREKRELLHANSATKLSEAALYTSWLSIHADIDHSETID